MYRVTLTSSAYDGYRHHKDISHWSRNMTFDDVSEDDIENTKGEIATVITIDGVPCPSSWWAIERVSNNPSVLNDTLLTETDKKGLDKYIRILKKSVFDGTAEIDLGNFTLRNSRLVDKHNNSFSVRGQNLVLSTNTPRNIAVTRYILLGLKYVVSEDRVVHPKNTGISYDFNSSAIVLKGIHIFTASFRKVLGYLTNGESLGMTEVSSMWHHPYYTSNFTLIDNHKNLSFLPDGKEDKASNYQSMKLGKIFKKLSISTNSSSSIETFVNSMMALDPHNLDFKIVKGEDIKKYYNGAMHETSSNLGSLGNSCMRHSKCSNYFDLYVKNPDKCSMLMLLSPAKKVLGRAILWRTDTGELLMDRVYGADSTIPKFKNWALHNNYQSKHKQSYSSPHTWDIGDAKGVERIYKISLDIAHDNFPYMDTFSNVYSDHISNKLTSGRVRLLSAQSQRGLGLEDTIWHTEVDTGRRIANAEATKIDSLKGYVMTNRTYKDAYTLELDLKEHFIQSSSGYNLLKRNSFVCSISDKIFPIKYKIRLIDGTLVHKRYAVKIPKGHIHTDYALYCSHSHRYFDKRTNKYITFVSDNHVLKANLPAYKKDMGIRRITSAMTSYKNY